MDALAKSTEFIPSNTFLKRDERNPSLTLFQPHDMIFSKKIIWRYSRHTLKSAPDWRVRLCLSAHKMRGAPSMKPYRSVEKKPMLLFKCVDYRNTQGGETMSNIWHDISPKRITPTDFMAVIEISQGSKEKYELDKETGMLMLDRILHTSMHYPANYGFIPRSYGDDGDPLDVVVLCSKPIIPLTLVRCYPIGVLKMIDNGRNDEKIIAVPYHDPNYNTYQDISELPGHIFEEMQHFFTVYKELENKKTAVDDVAGANEARQIISDAIENYIVNYCR